jgi:uncharacterized protein (DUF1501 family)
MNRRNFLTAALATGAYCSVRPSFLFAQSAPGKIKNFVHVFLYGGACSRMMYPFISGPVHEKLKEYRPQTYVHTGALVHKAHTQASRQNPVGFHPGFKGLLDTAQQLSCGLGVITEYGVTAGTNFSHEVAQKHFQSGTSKEVERLQQGWFGRLIDVAQLPALSSWLIGISDPFFGNAITGNQPIMLNALTNFNLVNRSSGSVSCPGKECAGMSGDTISDAVDDSALSKEITKKILSMKHPEMGYADAFSQALNAAHSIIPKITEISAVQGVLIDDFKPATVTTDAQGKTTVSYVSNSFQNTMFDITKSIIYTNSSQSGDLAQKSKIFCTGVGGWDAHVGTEQSYGGVGGRVSILGNALKGMILSPSRANLLKDTVIMVHTEFGRTTRQNGSAGLDHAAASYCMLLGGGISSIVHGPDPSLTEATTKNFFTPQVSFTGVLRQILSQCGFTSDQLNQVFRDNLPGEVVLPLFV